MGMTRAELLELASNMEFPAMQLTPPLECTLFTIGGSRVEWMNCLIQATDADLDRLHAALLSKQDNPWKSSMRRFLLEEMSKYQHLSGGSTDFVKLLAEGVLFSKGVANSKFSWIAVHWLELDQTSVMLDRFESFLTINITNRADRRITWID